MNPFAHFEDQFGHLQLSDNDAALHVFLAGWNSAMMEMMQRVNKMPFGDDTRASFAVYFQSQMVNVDAIEKPAQQDTPPPCPTCEALARTVMLDQTSHDTHCKPLTNEQFQDICNRLSRQGGWDGDGWDLALKEAIEAAHGIGEKK